MPGWGMPPVSAGCFGDGLGMATCARLGVTAISRPSSVGLYPLPPDGEASRLATIGGDPFLFDFKGTGGWSGMLAFTNSGIETEPPLLLVTDHGHDAVHLIDVVSLRHMGFVGGLGKVPGPRGVAAGCCVVAVSCWKEVHCGQHVVLLFEGRGDAWTLLRTVGSGTGTRDGQFHMPYGLRFTGDGGSSVAVADCLNDRVSLFRFTDGTFMSHVATGVKNPLDVEEHAGGWLVACAGCNTVEFVEASPGAGQTRVVLGRHGPGIGQYDGPATLALVPCFGLLTRELRNDGRVQVYKMPGAVPCNRPSGVAVPAPPPAPVPVLAREPEDRVPAAVGRDAGAGAGVGVAGAEAEAGPVQPDRPEGMWLVSDAERWIQVDAVCALALDASRAENLSVCTYRRGGDMYIVNMNTLRQRNVRTGFMRELMWVSTVVTITPVDVVPPSEWVPGQVMIDVLRGSPEWTAVVGRVCDSVPTGSVIAVQRVQVCGCVLVASAPSTVPVCWFKVMPCAPHPLYPEPRAVGAVRPGEGPAREARRGAERENVRGSLGHGFVNRRAVEPEVIVQKAFGCLCVQAVSWDSVNKPGRDHHG